MTGKPDAVSSEPILAALIREHPAIPGKTITVVVSPDGKITVLQEAAPRVCQ